MMLPGYALASQGTQVHAALWPGWEKTPGDGRILLGAPTFIVARLRQSGGVLCYLQRPDFDLSAIFQSDGNRLGVWEHTGQSAIIDPRGEIIAAADSRGNNFDRRRVL